MMVLQAFPWLRIDFSSIRAAPGSRQSGKYPSSSMKLLGDRAQGFLLRPGQTLPPFVVAAGNDSLGDRAQVPYGRGEAKGRPGGGAEVHITDLGVVVAEAQGLGLVTQVTDNIHPLMSEPDDGGQAEVPAPLGGLGK